jgi:S-formylglutathione hydrolase FrmB
MRGRRRSREWRNGAMALVGLMFAVLGVGATLRYCALRGADDGSADSRPAGIGSGSPGCSPGVDSMLSAADPSAPGGRRAVWVHRPVGGDSAAIPVLYLLHGYPGSPAAIAASALPRVLDQQMCASGRPFVIAVPDGRVAGTDTEWGDAANGAFAVEQFVTTTAVALVEGTDHRRPATLRAIGGFSMGGYGAAVLALRHPAQYRQVAAFAGYFHPDDPDHVFGDGAQHAPDSLLASGAGQRYFLVEGADENTGLMVGSIRGEADRFAGLLRTAGITVTVAHPPGGHSEDAWYPQLTAMAAFLDAGWASETDRSQAGQPPYR